jgi:nucleotide-binding universal stress UspA family protein
MTTVEQDKRVIVVGVDGSPGSLRAMRWAIAEAQLRDCAIEAVTVWRAGSSYGASSSQDAERIQSGVLQEAVAGLVPEPQISEEIETGDPQEVLVTRSAHASLLVVGSHGVSSVRHAALGSTSEYCSRMATCPVVVLPMPTAVTRRDELARR